MTDRTITEAAERLYHRAVLGEGYGGACYHVSLFLKYYLEHRAIPTEVVLGFVNDGTNDIYIPHAWVEHDDRRTDIAIALPNDESGSPPGTVYILGEVYAPGHPYTYHRTRPVDAQAGLDPTAEPVVRSEVERAATADILAAGDKAIRRYLDGAPLDYATMKEMAARRLR